MQLHCICNKNVQRLFQEEEIKPHLLSTAAGVPNFKIRDAGKLCIQRRAARGAILLEESASPNVVPVAAGSAGILYKIASITFTTLAITTGA